MELDIEVLNRILSNFRSIESNRELTLIERINGHQGVSSSSYSDGVQDEFDEYHKIFKMKGIDGIYLKLTYITDSYGSNDSVEKIQFVKAKEKTILVFE